MKSNHLIVKQGKVHLLKGEMPYKPEKFPNENRKAYDGLAELYDVQVRDYESWLTDSVELADQEWGVSRIMGAHRKLHIQDKIAKKLRIKENHPYQVEPFEYEVRKEHRWLDSADQSWHKGTIQNKPFDDLCNYTERTVAHIVSKPK